MIRTVGAMALAAMTQAPASAQDEAAKPQRVLVVLAHPDDELPMAPALAALARQGAQVTIFHATRGDAGPGVSGLPKGAKLAKRRSAEAWCSALALGVWSHAIAEHGDGKLAEDAHGEDSSAKILAEQFKSRFELADVVLTWGPDGGYGHADHRMVSVIATQVAQAMPASTRPMLLYVAIPSGRLPPVPEMADWATTEPALLTKTIAYTPADLAAAKAAAQCHVTQFDEATRAGMMPLFDATMWQGKVHFRPAF